MIEPDVCVDPLVARGVANVLADQITVRNRLGVLPWPKCISHGEHVGVRTDSGITEQVPGATYSRTVFKDDERLLRAPDSEVMSGADAGESGPHNQNVKMLNRVAESSHPSNQESPLRQEYAETE